MINRVVYETSFLDSLLFGRVLVIGLILSICLVPIYIIVWVYLHKNFREQKMEKNLMDSNSSKHKEENSTIPEQLEPKDEQTEVDTDQQSQTSIDTYQSRMKKYSNVIIDSGKTGCLGGVVLFLGILYLIWTWGWSTNYFYIDGNPHPIFSPMVVLIGLVWTMFGFIRVRNSEIKLFQLLTEKTSEYGLELSTGEVQSEYECTFNEYQVTEPIQVSNSKLGLKIVVFSDHFDFIPQWERITPFSIPFSEVKPWKPNTPLNENQTFISVIKGFSVKITFKNVSDKEGFEESCLLKTEGNEQGFSESITDKPSENPIQSNEMKSIEDRIVDLEKLYEKGVISQDEYNKKRKSLIDSI